MGLNSDAWRVSGPPETGHCHRCERCLTESEYAEQSNKLDLLKNATRDAINDFRDSLDVLEAREQGPEYEDWLVKSQTLWLDLESLDAEIWEHVTAFYKFSGGACEDRSGSPCEDHR